MKLFTCSDIESQLIEILEGNLSPADLESARVHLRDCSECRDLVAFYQPLFKFDTAFQTPAPETLWRSVQNSLNELEEGRRSQPTLFPKRRPYFGYTLQALGVAVAIIAGVLLGKIPESSQTTYEEEIVSYYAGALSESALPLSEVYTQVSSSQGDTK
jgi:predicted anti-sigma-YlaC factor YlaD